MDEHSDLFTDEDKENTIQGLGFKDKATAIKSINIIKRSGKPHAHKIQAEQGTKSKISCTSNSRNKSSAESIC